MARKILTVGVALPSDDAEFVAIDSDRSLFDADIILFRPGIPQSYYERGQAPYQGRPTLGMSGSFKAVEHARHWRAELKTAVEEGKTVIVFLAQPIEVNVHTGEKEYSGTGRNRQTINIVTHFTSYQALPVEFANVVPRRGQEIRPSPNLGPVASYWREFGTRSPYEVYLEGDVGKVLLRTKTGSKVVGSLINAGKGHLLLLPPVLLNDEAFYEDDEQSQEYWSKEGLAFGGRLVAALLRLDADLREETDATPPPVWTTRDEYRFTQERQLEAQIGQLTAQLEALRTERDLVSSRLHSEGTLRRLLYATGTELEGAILEALRILGYVAENLREGESEFDSVFVSAEGDRYIGEAEGKESKPLNIDKLSQLERNIQEDFAREEVEEHAKGVLFGNAHRLEDPAKRGEYFTDKCRSGARRSGIALVRTPDLFRVAKLLRDAPNGEFAAACRRAIRDGAGSVVEFPDMGTDCPGNEPR